MARPSRQQRQVAELLRTFEPAIAQAFRDAIAKATASIDLKQLKAALESRDIERAVRLFRLEQGAFFPLADAIRSAYVAGGALTGSGLPLSLGATFGFNGRHMRAEAWITRQGGDLITGIMDDTLQMVRDVVTAGVSEGTASVSIGRDLVGRKVGRKRVGGFLGLNGPQTDSVLSGRAKLLSGDPKLMREYLNLSLRDRRFDGVIRKAIDGGGKISVGQADRIIEGHKSKALLHRGRVIAKNETHTALAAGREEGFQQVLEGGKVESISVRWQHKIGRAHV